MPLGGYKGSLTLVKFIIPTSLILGSRTVTNVTHYAAHRIFHTKLQIIVFFRQCNLTQKYNNLTARP